MLYRRQPHIDVVDCSDGGWYEVINTEVEADDGPCVVALAQTETMALHIQLIPEMKDALAELLRVAEHQLEQSNRKLGVINRNAITKAIDVLANLKVLE